MDMQGQRIDDGLRALSDLSERLNAATDDLNATLADIEARINRLALGVEAWHEATALHQEFTEEWTAEDGTPTRDRIAIQLGYARFREGWALAIRTATYQQTLQIPIAAEAARDWCDTGLV